MLHIFVEVSLGKHNTSKFFVLLTIHKKLQIKSESLLMNAAACIILAYVMIHDTAKLMV